MPNRPDAFQLGKYHYQMDDSMGYSGQRPYRADAAYMNQFPEGGAIHRNPYTKQLYRRNPYTGELEKYRLNPGGNAVIAILMIVAVGGLAYVVINNNPQLKDALGLTGKDGGGSAGSGSRSGNRPGGESISSNSASVKSPSNTNCLDFPAGNSELTLEVVPTHPTSEGQTVMFRGRLTAATASFPIFGSQGKSQIAGALIEFYDDNCVRFGTVETDTNGLYEFPHPVASDELQGYKVKAVFAGNGRATISHLLTSVDLASTPYIQVTPKIANAEPPGGIGPQQPANARRLHHINPQSTIEYR